MSEVSPYAQRHTPVIQVRVRFRVRIGVRIRVRIRVIGLGTPVTALTAAR